jgi:hypothetical protein
MVWHVGGIENSGVLQIFVEGKKVFSQVLWTLEELQDSRQLKTSVPVFSDSVELSFGCFSVVVPVAQFSQVVEYDYLVDIEHSQCPESVIKYWNRIKRCNLNNKACMKHFNTVEAV